MLKVAVKRGSSCCSHPTSSTVARTLPCIKHAHTIARAAALYWAIISISTMGKFLPPPLPPSPPQTQPHTSPGPMSGSFSTQILTAPLHWSPAHFIHLLTETKPALIGFDSVLHCAHYRAVHCQPCTVGLSQACIPRSFLTRTDSDSCLAFVQAMETSCRFPPPQPTLPIQPSIHPPFPA